MPLRYVKRRLTGQNVLTVAVATTSVTYELADMLQFPPARAATGILLLIFQTIQVSVFSLLYQHAHSSYGTRRRTYKATETNVTVLQGDV